MSSTYARITRNLRRPLPDLYGYVGAKLLSFIWRQYLKKVGQSFHICLGARIGGGRSIIIGDHFHGGPMLWIEAVHQYLDYRYDPSIDIGSNVTCSEFVHIAATGRVTIQDGVLIGSRVHITDHAHGNYHGDIQDNPSKPPAQRPLSIGSPVNICANVWLGDGVVVLPGVTIGEGTIVGANSVVSRDLPPWVIAVGAPAIPIKYYDTVSRSWLPITKSI